MSFCYKCYVARYPDIYHEIGISNIKLDRHYKKHGQFENRDCSCSSDHGAFLDIYLTKRSELKAEDYPKDRRVLWVGITDERDVSIISRLLKMGYYVAQSGASLPTIDVYSGANMDPFFQSCQERFGHLVISNKSTAHSILRPHGINVVLDIDRLGKLPGDTFVPKIMSEVSLDVPHQLIPHLFDIKLNSTKFEERFGFLLLGDPTLFSNFTNSLWPLISSKLAGANLYYTAESKPQESIYQFTDIDHTLGKVRVVIVMGAEKTEFYRAASRGIPSISGSEDMLKMALKLHNQKTLWTEVRLESIDRMRTDFGDLIDSRLLDLFPTS